MASEEVVSPAVVAWEKDVASAATAAQLIAVMDPSQVQQLTTGGLTKDRILAALQPKRMEDPERWKQGVADAFRVFLQHTAAAIEAGFVPVATHRVRFADPVTHAGDDAVVEVGGGAVAGGNDGKGKATDAGRPRSTSVGSLDSVRSHDSALAVAVAPNPAAVAIAVPRSHTELLEEFRTARDKMHRIVLVVNTVMFLYGLVDVGTSVFDVNPYGADSSACTCVLVNAYFGVLEGAAQCCGACWGRYHSFSLLCLTPSLGLERDVLLSLHQHFVWKEYRGVG